MPKGSPKFDHGAALRVPPLHDRHGWGKLWQWLGPAGDWADEAGALQVDTPAGLTLAHPGDWIVLSVSGEYHIARSLEWPQDAGPPH